MPLYFYFYQKRVIFQYGYFSGSFFRRIKLLFIIEVAGYLPKSIYAVPIDKFFIVRMFGYQTFDDTSSCLIQNHPIHIILYDAVSLVIKLYTFDGRSFALVTFFQAIGCVTEPDDIRSEDQPHGIFLFFREARDFFVLAIEQGDFPMLEGLWQFNAYQLRTFRANRIENPYRTRIIA